MMQKKITLTFYRQNHYRPDWFVDTAATDFVACMNDLAEDLARFGIQLDRVSSNLVTIDVNSYADILNAVRISSPADGCANLCIGHIIGKSPNCLLAEDIAAAVNRIAFAPETIPPEDHNRRVCHNCGCGC